MTCPQANSNHTPHADSDSHSSHTSSHSLSTRKPQTKEIPNEIIIPQVKAFLDEGRTVTLAVKGKSMRPFLEGGRDAVVIAPVRAPLAVGDVILAEVSPQKYMLHRIIALEGDMVTMQGDGNLEQTETFERQHVIGLIIGFQRKGRTKIDLVTGRKWRLYSKVWRWLTPFRRILLGLHRHIWLRYFAHDYFLHPKQ